MNISDIRVRFAPSPTGLMHLGSVRTALMNYLFAQQKNGTFILRIEDTDPNRDFDPQAKNIMNDLAWLSLNYTEGPIVGGPCAPYYQSERMSIYQEYMEQFHTKKVLYRCFCTAEELELKRQRQIAMKLPPRYDRACTKLSTEIITERLAQQHPFIWRIKLDHTKQITITDLAHGTITFDFKHFSDFPITRQDGSFTFIFANFVDDVTMRISHVVRGEDHLTNTASQAALYDALGASQPIFWHMPILCSRDGKKMSKRDFGFSVKDLKDGGYLPEAILNYLAIIGGGNFKQEIMPLNEIAQAFDFAHISTTGRVTYDLEKLQWMNHKWIDIIAPEKLLAYCRPILQHTFPQSSALSDTVMSHMLQIIKSGMVTLLDCTKELAFYFNESIVTAEQLRSLEQVEQSKQVIVRCMNVLSDSQLFMKAIKEEAHKKQISLKSLFQLLRLALMGTTKGPAIHELIDILGHQESLKRIEKIISE